jgi:MFS family permease
MPARHEKAGMIALALSVGVVLADSSVVTLALPDVLREYDASVVGVSWVLTAFNIVLALAIVPAARGARENPRVYWAGGLVLFAAASLSCALAPSLGVLIVARSVQALGGAATIAGAIELLARRTGTHELAAGWWGAAGTAGLAIGPAFGGLLTELLSWQSIFFIQLPLLLLLPLARIPLQAPPEPGPDGPLDANPEIGLAFLSAGLTGALFLLVILLTEGFALTPLAAAATVSAIPLATFSARLISRRVGPPRSAALTGAIAVAGGLTALGLLPAASFGLTIPPQLLIGAGLALALPVLTSAALGGRDPHGTRAATTLAARHAGIVVGIALLTPILSARLVNEQDRAQSAATSLLLDAPLPPETKLDLGESIGARIDASDGQLPDLSVAFDAVTPPSGSGAAYAQLQSDMDDQLERAATSAFGPPFLGAAAFATLSLIPIGLFGRGRRRA